MDPARAKLETWDLDDDEIASIDSDDLHRHRPNRWTGPASTWRGLTEEERLLWRSMKRLGDQDLAVHLYNAFALKRRARDPATAQDVTIRLANGREAVWMPPKAWTAWPLELEHLPREDFIARDEDEDDEFTYRNGETVKMPSTDLQDELSATVLRMAKDRFRRRRGVGRYHDFQRQQTQPSETVESAHPSSGAAAWDTESEHESKHAPTTEAEEEHTPVQQGEKRKRRPPKTYRPVVSTDDDRSYEMLAPPVRHILSQMDQTLRVLHTLRANGAGYQSDSSTDPESDSSHGDKQKKPRGRSRPAENHASTSKTSQKSAVSANNDGVSHEDSPAQERRRRASSARSEADEAFESWLRAGDETTSQLASDTEMNHEDKDEHGDPTSSRSVPRQRIGDRLRLRDWSDVIGAASLTGFPPDVIARTTRRCANLFGEGMVLRRFEETPAARRAGIQTTEYRPEPIALSPPGWDESSSDEADHSGPHSSSAPSPVLQLRRHILSRQASSSSLSPPPSRSHSPSKPTSRSGSRSRSLHIKSSPSPMPRSRSSSRSSVGQHFCPVPTCERSASGFGRRANLKRHMDLVHGGLSEQAVVVDEDSDEEVVGAVHVDGFLKTLVPGRGWRGEDVMPRKRMGYRGQRKGQESNIASRHESTDNDDDDDDDDDEA